MTKIREIVIEDREENSGVWERYDSWHGEQRTNQMYKLHEADTKAGKLSVLWL